VRTEHPKPNSSEAAAVSSRDLWEERFAEQPVCVQIWSAEQNLRSLLRRFVDLRRDLSESSMRQELSVLIIELEQEINLLEETADHAHAEVVTKPPRTAKH
jgi:LPS O-antigen subunit length determinant protein (WzzB/FepE family)